MTACVGVDLGYGMVKVVPDPPRRASRFPAWWAPHARGAERWGIGRGDTPLLVNGHAIIAGAAAAARPGARRPFADGRLADPEAFPLLAAALWESGADGDVILGSGTPLDRFDIEREESRRALEGMTVELERGAVRRTVRIVRVALQPQGVGAAAHLAAIGRIDGHVSGYAVVVDVGTRTTDVLTVLLPKLTPVRELSFSLEVGVNTAAERLALTLRDVTGMPVPPDVAMAALSEPVAWAGRQVGGPDDARGPLDELASALRSAVRSRFGQDAGRVACWAAVGGGAVLLGGRIDGLLPGDRIPVGPRDAVFANAAGFHLAAQRAQRRARVG